jgi:hypothetical protein
MVNGECGMVNGKRERVGSSLGDSYISFFPFPWCRPCIKY